MGNTSIEWTDKTWGPVVGCTRKSPGCERCYAEELAARNVPEYSPAEFVAFYRRAGKGGKA